MLRRVLQEPPTLKPLISFLKSRPTWIALSLMMGASSCIQDMKSALQGDPVPQDPLSLSFTSGVSLGFGGVTPGTSRTAFLSLTVIGNGSATFTGTEISASAFTFHGGVYPGTGGTCTETITRNCTLVVQFTPTAAELYSGELTFRYRTAGQDRSAGIHLTGHGLPTSSTGAFLSISHGPTLDFGSTLVGATSDQTVTLTNSGNASATSMISAALSAPFSFVGGTYPGTGGTCGSSLAAAGQCTVVLRHAPTASGSATGSLQLSYNSGSGTLSVSRSLQGTGQTPAVLSISHAPELDFGQVLTGSVQETTLTITHGGDAAATSLSAAALSAPFQFKGGAYPGTGGTCSTFLTASQSCTMVVTYTPTATGSHSASLGIQYHNGLSPLTASRNLKGTATLPQASLSISHGPTHDYGLQSLGSETHHVFTVSVSGSGSATSVTGSGLAAPFSFTGGNYPGTGGTCASTISASCTLSVTFTPTTPGTHTNVIELSYESGAGLQSAQRTVTGRGRQPALLTLSEDPFFDFGSALIGEVLEHIFTVTPSGDSPAANVTPGALVAPFVYKGGSYPGSGGTCGSTIAEDCTIVVQFRPTAAGFASGAVTLNYEDGTSSQVATRPVSGNGLRPATLTLSHAPSHDFGNVAVGSSASQSFTVTNTGDVVATSLAISSLASPFARTGGTCGTSLNAGGTCTVEITFTPTTSGAASGTLTLQYQDGIASQSVSRSLTGTGNFLASLSISDGPTYSFGNAPIAYSREKTFTVRNLGGVSATTMSGAALSSPFSWKGGSYPGTGGTCGSTLAVNAQCTLVIRYAPVTAGNHSGTIILNYNNAQTMTSSARSVTGVGTTITQLAAGANHSCALYSTGEIRCWGADAEGQLGNDGIASVTPFPTPVPVIGISTATGIAAGDDHSCALLSNGSASCWGSDTYGQLGDDAILATKPSPVSVATTTNFVQIAAGGRISCGRTATGSLDCWGDDTDGAMGDGNSVNSKSTPFTVPSISGVSDLAVGSAHVCATTTGGGAYCWGSDTEGQLGNNAPFSSRPIVTSVNGISSTGSRIWAGGRVSVARLMNGSSMIWGSDTFGQLGNGSPLTSSGIPVSLALSDPLSFAGGLNHLCTITSAGTAQCWGSNASGQVGDNAGTGSRSSPANVSGLGSVTQIAAGAAHTCAVETTGRVWCWGSNASGQLGYGSTGGSSSIPVQVIGL